MTLHGYPLARVSFYRMKCVPWLALIVAAVPAFGGEYVVFSSGLKLRADRHEQSGDVIRLFYNGGVTEVPNSLVSGFEQEEMAPAAPVVVSAVSKADPSTPEPKETRTQDTRSMIRDAALRSGLPPEFVESVALVESGFRPDAVSPKGALGVMQLMPGSQAAARRSAR